MSRVRVGCGATVLLTLREWERLAALPEPGNEVEPLHWCELEPRHGGLHFAFGQQSGEDAWWVVFDLGAPARRELQILVGCSAAAEEADELGDRGVCTLAADHAGGHSFEIALDTGAGRSVPVLLPALPDPAALTAVQQHNHAVLAAAGLTAATYLQMESLQHQESRFGVISTRHLGLQTNVAVPRLACLAADTSGLAAAVAQGYLAVPGPRTRPPVVADAQLADSAVVHLTDTGRALLARLQPQLQD
ncbi:hypothetical protein [Amycolatopsis sp. NPDC051903]|uniref:hypothetical protein n=1 Tax=Amycolatopsis sp. NPDC051903 TaxID=3363936 RepID=UPI0037A08EE9